jgi:hypothetical protein
MTEFDRNMRGIGREWLAARIVVLGGFVIAIAVAAYFTLRPAPVVEQQPPAPVAQPTLPAQTAAQRNVTAGAMLCVMALQNAKNYGIVPAYGRLTSMAPKFTHERGRYICTAGTSVGTYVITADLLCRNLTDTRCVVPFIIKRDDGTLLYQRQSP